VPNLDAMPISELRKFRKKYANPSQMSAMRLVGIRSDAVKIAQELSKYAFYKSKAMAARGRGDLRRAIPDENFCETIYRGLPDDIKW